MGKDSSDRIEYFKNQFEMNDGLNEKKFLTISEAACYLNVSVSCMYKKTYKREISFYKPGKKIIYFLKEDLDSYVLNGKQSSKNIITTTMAEMISQKGGSNG
jgi:excisionase family DNA binding protein